MHTLAEVLRSRIRELDFDDIKECARQYDIPYELLRKVISDGHLPKDKTLLFYAEKFGLNAADLISMVYRQRAPSHLQYLFDGPSGLSPAPVGDTGRMAPVLGRAACGEWLESYAVEPDAYEPVDVGDADAFFVTAEGESMVGGNILPGAYLLVSPGTRVSNGDIVLARKGDEEFTVKTFFRQGNGTTILQPMNPAFEPIVVTPEEQLTVMRITEIRLKI
jgi:SOS-response transcriptional repressor LexA